MDAAAYIDIDALVAELDSLRGRCEATDFPETSASFLRPNVSDLLALLRELRYRRGKDDLSLPPQAEKRIIVEGFSEDSAAAALSDGLAKAAQYFSERYDISITLLKLQALPKGGHRAELEIHVTPIVLKDRKHSRGLEAERHFIAGEDAATLKKLEADRVKHRVFDHFAATSGGPAVEVPDYFLINITDAQLMNHMIEKEFFRAEHPDLSLIPVSIEAQPLPTKILVRTMPQPAVPGPHAAVCEAGS